MEAKELMVSDLVVNTEFGGKQIGRIECIEPTRVWLQGGKSYTPISYIEPIPLTSEILEKNGFIEEQRDCQYKPLQYCVLVDGLWIDISGENYFEGKLEYVHQLQHALRLCGIEKEIIL